MRAALSAVFAEESRRFGIDARDDFDVVSLQTRLASSVRRTLFTLLAAVGLVLLVAAANVASLWSARGLVRGRELAIRQTLGAGRARLSRLVVVEALVLSVAGGAAGVAVAGVIQRILVAHAPASLPRLSEIGLHAPVMVFGITLGMVVGLGSALLPLRRVSDAALSLSILGAPRGGRASMGWLGGTPLVACEVALASLLTVGAGLLIRSYVNAERTSLGFDGRGVLTARVDLPPSDTAAAMRDAVVARFVDAVGAIPGATRVAATDDIPLSGAMATGYRVSLVHASADSAKPATIHAATPGYFAAMGIPILRGRDFTAADRRDAPRVYIISDSLRRRLVGDGDPIGRRIAVWRRDTGTVVGVVADVRHRGPELPTGAQFYEPFAQSSATAVGIVVRGEDDAAAARLAPMVRQAVRGVVPELAPYDFLPMARRVSRVMSARRFVLGLLVSFAFVALALTAVGVYGVVSYAVERRRRELGIRAALGARSWTLVVMTLRRSVFAALAGVGVAFVAVIPLRSLVGHFLFGVSPLDPVTLCGVAVTTLGVAVVASVVPGRRAGRIDAAQALRAE